MNAVVPTWIVDDPWPASICLAMDRAELIGIEYPCVADAPVELSVARPSRPRSGPAGIVHQATPFDDPDVTEMNGIPVTSIARTLADLDGSGGVRRLHVAEALSYRRLAPGR